MCIRDRELGVEFDCIYTGYLGGEEQVALAEKAFDLWPAARKVVDPVTVSYTHLIAPKGQFTRH